MEGERHVAGLWCHEVLARLYDYVDGELTPSQRSQVEEHLAGCSVCESFGGRAGALVHAIRTRLSAPDRISASLERKLLSVARPRAEDS